IHSWDSILLEPHLRNEDAVYHILSAQLELNGPAYRQNQRGRDNIVLSGGISRVDSQRIAFFRPSKFLSIHPAHDAVWPSEAEIPLNLCPGPLHLNFSARCSGRHDL